MDGAPVSKTGPMLESEEAARSLGVKLSTLYAYVSRGLLTSHPAPDGRRSLFPADEVEALARRSRGGRRTETRLATVTTAITQLRDDGPVYRGTRATDLATSVPYEDAAELLWQGDPPGARPWAAVPVHPPPDMGTSDRLRWAVIMCGARDELRSDLRPESVRTVARRLVATLVRCVGPVPGTTPGIGAADSVATALAVRLTATPDSSVVAAVNAALVLLADHELAASTLAVRVAASARADPYDAVLAGLALMGGALHGGASQLACTLLRQAHGTSPARAFNETLRWDRVLPGFGHTVYRGTDPRFAVLWPVIGRLAPPELRRTLDAVVDLAAVRGLPPPNVDLALAALALGAGMPDDAGRTIFTIARVAGWTAHYLEELGEPPLRYRARAVYAGRG
ncbi:MAG: citrate synthase [Acidimicrobiales bacterium]